MVLVFCGLNDDLLDLKLLPYFLGLRVGILKSDVAVHSVFCVKVVVSLERPFVGTGYSLVRPGAMRKAPGHSSRKHWPVFKPHLTCSHTLKIERYPLSGFWLASAEKAKVLLGNGYFAGISKVAFRRVN
jgi:hypothetical protein